MNIKNLIVRNIDTKEQKYSQKKRDYFLWLFSFSLGTRTFFPSQILGLNNAHDIKKNFNGQCFKQNFDQQLF